MTLDCESLETTVTSMAGIFRCSNNDILKTLSRVRLDKIPIKELLDSYIFQVFLDKFGEPSDLTNVCWFHLTRALPNSTFKEGILPLEMMKDRIWQALLEIVAGTEHYERLLKMKESGFDSYLYSLKMPSPTQGGPFAMLIREHAWHSESLGNHDHLALPEIIEDICDAYEKTYGKDIAAQVQKSLKPCIVKFQINNSDYPFPSSGWPEKDWLVAAFNYLYLERKGWNQKERLDSTMSFLACFNNKGKPVMPDQILKVEFV